MGGFITAAVITAAGAAYSADRAASAAKKSRKWQHRALDVQEEQYKQTREDWAPWREAGKNALANLQDPNAFQASPAYDFIRGEGMRDVENRYSVRGGGGNAMKDLVNFNKNLASTEWWNWRNDQRAMAGLGTTGNQASQQAGQWYGNAYQNVADNMGSIAYQNEMAKANAVNQGLSAVGYGIMMNPNAGDFSAVRQQNNMGYGWPGTRRQDDDGNPFNNGPW